MAPSRILQLITRADWGGAQRHIFDLAALLDRSRFELTVACAPDGALVDRLRALGVRVIPVPAFQRDISAVRDAQALGAVKAVINEVRPALVHSHSSKAGVLGRLAAHGAGIPSFYTAHGFAFGGDASSLPVRALSLASEWWAGRFWTDCLITVSEADRRLALRWKIARADRVVTVHNGIDVAPYERIPLPNPAERAPVVGVISRLVAGKGLEDLVNAAARLMQRTPCRLVIAGDGPLRAALESQVARLGIGGSVEFPGFVDPVAALQGMDVFVLPSYKEGLPYNILEAMAAGRAVVATPVGGVPEIITDGMNGRLVPVGNVAALADAIAEVAAPRRLRELGERGRARVREHFSHIRMAEAIAGLYERHLHGDRVKRALP